jgi:membrane associated rhomboid family serine protease
MFILPLRTDSPLRSTPWVNWLLILANFVVFVIQHKSGDAFTFKYEINPLAPSVLQYVTYAFLHGDVWHLLGNMVFLYIFGNNVNDKMGNIGYLAFYLAGGVFAAVGYVVLQHGAMLGASGAVSAVTGAYLILFPRSHVTIFYFAILFGTFEIPCMWLILFFFLKDLLMSFAIYAGDAMGHGVGIAYTAHTAGALFGLAVSFCFLVLHLLPRDQFDVLALLQRWNKRRQYQDLVRKGYNPFGYAPNLQADGKVTSAKSDPMFDQIVEMKGRISEALDKHETARAADLYIQLRNLDAQQVLARQNQLDVANFLAAEGRYDRAAEAYEQFLKHYPNYDQVGQIELMLGLIYTRYLMRNDKAKEHLARAAHTLRSEREIEQAQRELSRLETLLGGRPSTT